MPVLRLPVRRARRRRVLLAVLGIAGLLIGAPAAAAAAADPTPSPTGAPTFVEYTGALTTASPAGAAFPGSTPAHVRIDCASGTCLLTGIVDLDTGPFEFWQGARVVVVNGVATGSLPATGDPCGNLWIGAGAYEITASGTSITAVRHAAGSGSVNCGNGTTVENAAFVGTIVAAVSAGDPCVLFGTCVVPAAVGPTSTPTPAVAPAAIPGPVDPGLRALSIAHDAGAPSVLSALPTAATTFTPPQIVTAIAVAVVLTLLMGFPTQLMNSAVGKFSDRIDAWRERRRVAAVAAAASSEGGGAGDAEPPARTIDWRGLPLTVACILAASLVSSFVDPDFGFSLGSLRVLLSIAVGFVLDLTLGWLLLIVVTRRTHPTATASFDAKPVTLVIVVAAVLFTRLSGIHPGVVFGLVAGLGFAAITGAAEKARHALLGLGLGFVIAIAAWIAHSALVDGVAPDDFWATFGLETLASLAIGGIVGIPLGLLPVRGLTGFTVFAWRRVVWLGVYAVGLGTFLLLVVPLPSSWGEVPYTLLTWALIFVGYSVLAAGLWLAAARPWQKPVAAA